MSDCPPGCRVNFKISFLTKINLKSWKSINAFITLLLLLLFTFCLFLQVPPAMERIQNVTVKEGKNVALECKVTTGSPPLTVFWENVKSGQVIIGKLLNITNITGYQTEYRCIVNNTCGSDSSTVFIDVQCKNTSSTWLFFTKSEATSAVFFFL